MFSKRTSLAWSLALAVALILTILLSRAAQAQTYKVIDNFTGGADGGGPSAGLTLDRAGNLYGVTTQGGSGHAGTVFKVTHRGSGWVVNPLYAFQGGDDGESPYGGVVFGPDGTLYGTTPSGGGGSGCMGAGCGTVFNLRPPATACKAALCPWTKTILHVFEGGNDGHEPFLGDLAFDHAGNIYGTTLFGGSDDEGTVYKLTPSNGHWTESVIHTFTKGGHGAFPGSGVILDTAGSLYGTTESGYFEPYGVVFQLTPTGSGWMEDTVYIFQGGSDGKNPDAGLAIDNAGKLYGATSCGGVNSGGTIFELTKSIQWTFDLIYTLTWVPQTCGTGPSAALARDSAGNLYGTTEQEGINGYGNVFKLAPSSGGWIYTSLYDFAGGSDGRYPNGVTLDAAGNLYGTTSAGGTHGQGVIFEITP